MARIEKKRSLSKIQMSRWMTPQQEPMDPVVAEAPVKKKNFECKWTRNENGR